MQAARASSAAACRLRGAALPDRADHQLQRLACARPRQSETSSAFTERVELKLPRSSPRPASLATFLDSRRRESRRRALAAPTVIGTVALAVMPRPSSAVTVAT